MNWMTSSIAYLDSYFEHKSILWINAVLIYFENVKLIIQL